MEISGIKTVTIITGKQGRGVALQQYYDTQTQSYIIAHCTLIDDKASSFKQLTSNCNDYLIARREVTDPTPLPVSVQVIALLGEVR